MSRRIHGEWALISTVALGLAAACAELSVTAVDVADLRIVPDTASVVVGTTRQLSVQLRDASGNLLGNRPVSWSSSAPERARSEGDGRFTGLAPGPVTITATSGTASATAEVTVVAAAVIQAQPDRITLTLPQSSPTPASAAVEISNGGGGSLVGLQVTTSYASGQPTGWLTVALASATAPTSLTASATAGPLPAGTYQATITLQSSSPGEPTRDIPVELQIVTPAPFIDFSEPSVSFSRAHGSTDPAPRTITVQNGGGGTLTGLGASVAYASGQPGGWLLATLSPSTSPSTLTLSVQGASLAPGSYSATVDVMSPVASNSPRSLDVTLTVTDGAVIELSETARTFTSPAGGGSPGPHLIAIRNAGGGTLSGLTAAVNFTAGQPGDWLTATISEDTAPANLTLQVSTGALAPGSYTANVEVQSPVAANSPAVVAVTFQVTNPATPPAIGLSRDTITFAATAGGVDPSGVTVQVSNTGGGTLGSLTATVQHASGQAAGWLTAALSDATAPATLTVQPQTGSLVPGTYNATVDVGSPTANNSPQTIAVTFIIASAPVPPAIGVSPASIAFAATAGGPNPGSQVVSITNTGGGTLDGLTRTITYASGQPSGWLTATLSGTTAPAALTLQATTGSLPAGTYNATVDVTSPSASNSPQTIAVTFTVAPVQSTHLGGLTDSTPTDSGPTWRPTVTILVHDTNHAPRSGATVTGSWTFRDGSATVSCVTGANGTCTVSTPNAIANRNDTATFAVTNISGNYVPADNDVLPLLTIDKP